MHTATATLIRAPRQQIFETAANLENWPRILPHYRYIHYYERSPERNIVKMAAVRSGIPIAWTSEQIIDRERMEVRFTHLKAFTKGMHVVWTFHETPEGVQVEIVHDMNFRVPALAPLADKIIGEFFIDNVANRTLRCMKQHLEEKAQSWMGLETNVSWQTVAGEFEPDGSLRDIYVMSTTTEDWQSILNFLRQHGKDLTCTVDHEPTNLPENAADIFALHAVGKPRPLLTFRVDHILFSTHFFCEGIVEFDITPEDVRDQSGLDALLWLVRHIGDLLAKPVVVTPENYLEDPFLHYQPGFGQFYYTPSKRYGG